MNLSELSPQEQYAVMKLVMRGEKPFFKGEVVKVPSTISARYVCAQCGKFVMPVFHIEDIKSISTMVKCPSCYGNMSLYLMGTELDKEIKRIRESIQKKIVDFFR